MKRNERKDMRRLAAVMAAGAVTLLAGCRTGCRVEAGLPMYRDDAVQTSVMDVQVVRDDTHITMTNTTARSIGRARMWVNGWYSREIDGFGVGETLRLNLYDFKDAYGTPFKAGGFFATERPEKLVLAQIEPLDVEPRELLGLIVVGRSDEN